jgi:hypothetical protein
MNIPIKRIKQKFLPSSDDRIELIVCLSILADVCYAAFSKTLIYRKITCIAKTPAKCHPFTYTEFIEMQQAIRLHFKQFIEKLKLLCPELTYNEIIICILSLHYNLKTISLCFCYSNNNNVKQHKYRIRKKMYKNSDRAFLFDYFFKQYPTLTN